MGSKPLITTYLEMRSSDQLRPKRADAGFQVREKTDRDWRFNRDHPQALANYQARGMLVYKVEQEP